MQAFPAQPEGAPGAWSSRQINGSSSWRRVHALVTDEGLTRPWRGSYSTPQAPLVVRLRALQLSVGVPLVACHQTAAALHGFGVLDDGLLHVTTVDGRSLRRRSGVVMHQWVPRMTPVAVAGFLVTPPGDTAIDICCTSQEIDILPVLDAALGSGVSDTTLAAAVNGAKGRRGIRTVKQWSELADATAESPMESRTRFRVLSGGLPPPELQIRVDMRSGTRRLDMGWRRRRVGLEYDGEEFHSGDGRLALDRRRHNELLDAGWTVLHATATDIWRCPGPLIAQLRGLLN